MNKLVVCLVFLYFDVFGNFYAESFKEEYGGSSMVFKYNQNHRNESKRHGKQYKRSSSVEILMVDMRYAMQQTILRYAREAFQQSSSNVARRIKDKLQLYYSGTYQ
ncbi:Hypothetical predicted protein, partial [Mytilus galloprovincialis]